MIGLDDKQILITGAASGIGRALAELAIEGGAIGAALAAWLAVFLAPFVVLFAVPFRSTVDWDGIVSAICNTTFSTIFHTQLPYATSSGLSATTSGFFLLDPMLTTGATNRANQCEN